MAIFIYTSPWFFTRGGNVGLNNGSLRLVGFPGYYWSNTASISISNAYFFGITAAEVQPSNFTARWDGFSVRCVTAGFTRGGLVDLNNGSLRHIGNIGYYWSSTASTNASNAYVFLFDASITHASNVSHARRFGLSVRCVTRGHVI